MAEENLGTEYRSAELGGVLYIARYNVEKRFPSLPVTIHRLSRFGLEVILPEVVDARIRQKQDAKMHWLYDGDLEEYLKIAKRKEGRLEMLREGLIYHLNPHVEEILEATKIRHAFSSEKRKKDLVEETLDAYNAGLPIVINGMEFVRGVDEHDLCLVVPRREATQ